MDPRTQAPDGGDANSILEDGGVNSIQAGCAMRLFGQYLLRTDGRLLLELDGTGADEAVQLPVLDAATDEPLTDVVAASQGLRHACALVGSTKTIWCWRAPGAKGNDVGQLGSGVTDESTTELRASQVLVSAGTPLGDVVALSEAGTNGLDATCAVTTSGNLFCWGDLSDLNDGKTLKQPFATQITTDGVNPFAGALRVSARAGNHYGHACAVAQAGASRGLWCWGKNGNGGLGLGDKGATTFRQYPTRVPGLTDPAKVLAFGQGHGATCAIDAGRVLCWGNNSMGQVGNGTKKDTLSPSLVVSATGQAIANVVDIAAGDDNVCALKEGGTAICWGQGFGVSPTAYPASGIAALGSLGIDPKYVRFLTSDGRYHVAPLAARGSPIIREVRCGSL